MKCFLIKSGYSINDFEFDILDKYRDIGGIVFLNKVLSRTVISRDCTYSRQVHMYP